LSCGRFLLIGNGLSISTFEFSVIIVQSNSVRGELKKYNRLHILG
jgi:hypothetical protein